MCGIGVAVADGRLGGPVRDRVVDAVGHENGTHRHIARSQTLCRGHEIRHNVVLLTGEERADTAKAGDDLIGNEQNIVLLANSVHGLQPGRWRNEDAS
jgi:hypothetical protein